MNENALLKDRGTLSCKMSSVFDDEIKQLSPELQEMLIDDMVTAFQNRLNVLNRISHGSGF
ncbi:MAG: hypothetical protein NWF04_03200 [Candidatus Bathyarchaeota archaeon]|nr:hypothetical protein [Candidatus Bathyarchaeota archaeon]